MRKNSEKIFWGVFLILGAVFLVASRLGFLQGISLGRILFSILWIAVLIKGIVKVRFGEILFSIAFLCIIYDEFLGIEALTPWTVLAAALLGTVGLNLLFRRKRHFHRVEGHGGEFAEGAGYCHTEEGGQGETVFCEANFSSVVKYVDSRDFQYASLECNFGGMKVYFDQAAIPSGNATVELDVSFAGVELYVPKEWNVVNNAVTSFAGIDEKGRNRSEGTPVLSLVGDVNFGGVTIIYV